jgi:hypothetical protein
MIPRCRIVKSAGPVANGSFRAHFFSGTATVVTNGDNAAFTPTNTTIMGLYLGYLDVVMAGPLGGWGWATDMGAPVWVPGAAADLLNVLLEARAAYVPTAQEVFTITPEIDYVPS